MDVFSQCRRRLKAVPRSAFCQKAFLRRKNGILPDCKVRKDAPPYRSFLPAVRIRSFLRPYSFMHLYHISLQDAADMLI